MDSIMFTTQDGDKLEINPEYGYFWLIQPDLETRYATIRKGWFEVFPTLQWKKKLSTQQMTAVYAIQSEANDILEKAYREAAEKILDGIKSRGLEPLIAASHADEYRGKE